MLAVKVDRGEWAQSRNGYRRAERIAIVEGVT
jgi:hypothetical protein